MNKLIYLLIILFFGCYNNEQQNSNLEYGPTAREKQIALAEKLEFNNPSRPVKGTLIKKKENGDLLITPLGLFKTPANGTIQLQTELIVVQAYLYETETDYFIFFTDTDHNGRQVGSRRSVKVI